MHDKEALKDQTNPKLQEGSDCLPLEVPNKKRSLKKIMGPAEILQKQCLWKAKEMRKMVVESDFQFGLNCVGMQEGRR